MNFCKRMWQKNIEIFFIFSKKFERFFFVLFNLFNQREENEGKHLFSFLVMFVYEIYSVGI